MAETAAATTQASTQTPATSTPPAGARGPALPPAPAGPQRQKATGPRSEQNKRIIPTGATKRMGGVNPEKAPPSAISGEAAPQARPFPKKTALPGSETPTATSSPSQPAKPSEASTAESAQTTTSTTETPAAAESPPAESGKLGQEMAKLARRERGIVERENAIKHQEQANVTLRQQVDVINRFGQMMQKEPLKAITQVFGPTIAQQILDELLVAGGGKLPERAAQPAQPDEKDLRLRALEEQLRTDAESRRAADNQKEIDAYISTTLAPIVSDKAKFPFIVEELGANSARQLYVEMVAEHKRTGLQPDATEIARKLESLLRSRAERSAKLLGLSVTPAAATETATTATRASATTPPPPAQPSGTRRKDFGRRNYSVRFANEAKS